MPHRDAHNPWPDAISERVSRAFARADPLDPDDESYAHAHRADFHSGSDCDGICIPLTPPIGSRAERITDLARDLADAGGHGPDADLARARREHDDPDLPR